MRRLFKTTVLAVMLCILLCSCGNDIKEMNASNMETIDITETLQLSVDKQRYPIVKTYGISANCFGGAVYDNTYSDGFAYYVVAAGGVMPYNGGTFLCKKNVDTGKVTRIYTSEYENSTIVYMNVKDGYLYWTEVFSSELNNINTSGGRWCAIMQMNLENETVKEIASSEEYFTKIMPLFVFNNTSLKWIVANPINENTMECKIVSYDIKGNGRPKYVADNIYLPSPYETPVCTDTSLSYQTLGKDGKTAIYYKSSNNNRSICINTGLKKVARIAGSERYIIWIDEFTDSKMYIYDLNTEKLYKYDTTKAKQSFFHVFAKKDRVFIVMGVHNNIYELDLAKNTLVNVTGLEEGDGCFNFPAVLPEKDLVLCRSSKGFFVYDFSEEKV